jgi:hypothetical protein
MMGEGSLMTNIIDMGDFLRDKRFHLTVIPFLKKMNLTFQFYREKNEGLIVVKTDSYLFFFLNYVEQKAFTDYPSLQDRFHDIKKNPRFSNGEWVVEKIYELNYKNAKKLIKNLEMKKDSKNPNSITHLKNKMKE